MAEATKGFDKVILLWASVSADVGSQSKLVRVETILTASKVATVEKVDGANAENREFRNKLFGISGKRAIYPQVFLASADNQAIQYVGDYDSLSDEENLGELFKAVPKKAE